ncbi:MAG: type II secretion system F family protein [Candidatus Nanohaloarchaea archaeon]|nr:type II secretion system F family protein [Candidatus Nanohaloarchaea archaeon]
MRSPKRFSRKVWERLRRALQAENFAGASNALFGGLSDLMLDSFRDLEDDLEQANIEILYRTYLSEMFMGAFLAFLAGLGIVSAIGIVIRPPLLFTALLLLFFPIVLAILALMAAYFYPTWKARNRARDINRNLPFALNHMSAIAGAGVPPSSLFELLVGFEEYGEVAEEADEVVNRVKVFGDDVTSALRDVAEQTPSDDMREVFYGMVSTMETGGSLKEFLEERADRALFDYRLRREEEIDRLTTFASFYTALLVAAPLFLVTILAVMETIGGGLFGYPIKSRCGFINSLMGGCPMGVIDVGAYIAIPIANILFIILLEVTQPEI